ncbi:MAG TPA: hypothetical protein PLI62_14620 [Spirochaetota bacterium]|nr:hypothetical protein [Spirochaetota bacterium]HQP48843.1 hypothetical protein [Spirochaetota bacterium]
MDLNEIVYKIESLYNTRNFSHSWRLLNTKKEIVQKNNGIFIITLNPGTGKGRYKMHDYTLANEHGNSLLHEKWASPLQNQLKLMLKQIHGELKLVINIDDFIESILQGYFIPFRSESVDQLKVDEEILSLSNEIWRYILEINKDTVQLINCIGKIDVYNNIKSVLNDIGMNFIKEEKYKTGWGNYTVDISEYNNNGRIIKVIGYLHLSKFKIFGRPESAVYLKRIISESVDHII